MRSDLSLIAESVCLNKKKRKKHKKNWLAAALIFLISTSANAGLGTWTSSSDTPGNINSIAMDPNVPSDVLISSGSSLARTADGGNSWEVRINGTVPESGKFDALPYFPSTVLSRLQSTTDIIFAGISSGTLYRHNNNSVQPNWPTTDPNGNSLTLPVPLYSSWDRIPIAGTPVGAIKALAAHPTQPWMAVSVANNGVYVTDEANKASTCNVGDLVSTPFTIDTYTYSDAGGLNTVTITRTETGSSVNVNITPSASFVLTNADTLTQNFKATPAVATTPTSVSVIFVPTPMKNTSTGTNYSFCKPTLSNVNLHWNTGSGGQIPAGSQATSIVYDPSLATSSTGFIYAGLDGKGAYFSNDNGITWQQDSGSTPGSNTPQNVTALTASYNGSNTILYAATTGSGAGVYKGVVTYDNATTPTTVSTIAWSKLSGTLPGLTNVRALAVDPVNTSRLYAGTWGYGVYYQDTSNGTWTDISNGLYTSNNNSVYVTSLQVDPLNPARIYAGTYGGFYTYEQLSTPKATFSASSLSGFSSTLLQQSITLTNSGMVPLSFSSASASGKYTVTSSCPPMLAVGSSCTLSVQYQPTTSNDTGMLSVATTDPSSPALIPLSGNSGSGSGASAPSLSVNGSGITQFTTTNTTQSATISNTGNSVLTITNIDVTGSFSQTNSCPSTLNPGKSCSVSISYLPKVTGSETSLLVIESSDPSNPIYQYPLSGSNGTGSSGSSGNASATPTTLAFPNVPVGQQSATQVITLKNKAGTAMSFNSATVDNPQFIVDSSACPNQVAAYATCQILATFLPTTTGTASGTLSITTDGTSTLSIPLTASTADLTSLTGTAYGSTASRSLIGNFFFSSREKAKTGNLYIAAQVNGTLFFFDGISWFPWVTGTPRAFVSSTTYADQSVSILNRMDTTTLRGVPIYLGFGSSVSDLQKNQTYSQIYVLQ